MRKSSCWAEDSLAFIALCAALVAVLGIFGVSAPAAGKDAPLVLIDKGAIRYGLVVAPDAAPATKYAAQEMDRFLREIGSAADITTPAKPVVSIYIGPGGELAKACPNLKTEGLGDEEYIIRSQANQLAIVGGSPRGTMNGVYGLLEDQFGCRWFNGAASLIPKRERVGLPALDRREGPAFVHLRYAYEYDAIQNREWAARNRINTTIHDEKLGGPGHWFGGTAHTFHAQVPPGKFFATHPEYYALIDGQRNKEAQLCLSNPQVLDLVVQSVMDDAKAHPDKRVFTVCPMDHYMVCQCAECKGLDAREGGASGTVMWFVNQVAERVGKQNPDLFILGLAYAYYIDPPKEHMRPNVIIQLCVPSLTTGCGVHEIEKCEKMQDFRKLVEAWGKKSDRLWLWYYSTNFLDYFMPLPNIYPIGENYKFYLKNHVTGVFMQDTYDTPSAEGELRAYVCAKLMWNPERDVNTIVTEYLKGVYGKAAVPIKRYVDLVHALVNQPGTHMLNYTLLHETPLFTQEALDQAASLFTQAEKLAETPEIRERVQYMGLPVTYVRIKAAHGLVPGLTAKVGEEDYELVKRMVKTHKLLYPREGQVPMSQLMNTLKVRGAPLNHWWQLGPLPATSEDLNVLLKNPPPPFDLKKEFTGSDGKPVRWTKRPVEGKVLDINRTTPGRLNKDLIYAVTHVWAPEEMTVPISISTISLGFEVFLNGESIWESQTSSAMIIPDCSITSAKLKKGMNEIMVMMRYSGGGWQAMVRFDDPKGLLRNEY